MARRKLSYRYVQLNLDALADHISNADRGGSIDQDGLLTIKIGPEEAKELALACRIGGSLASEAYRKEQDEKARRS